MDKKDKDKSPKTKELTLKQALNLAGKFYKEDKKLKAKKIYKTIIKQQPENARAHNNLGVIYRDLGLHQKALDHYKQAIEANPKHYGAYNNMSVLLKLFMLDDEAEEACRKSIEIKPDNAKSYNNLGNILRKTGRTEEALKYYKKAVELEPKYAKAWQNITACITFTSPQQEEVKAIHKLLEATQNDGEDYAHLNFALGKIYKNCKDYKKSFKHYQIANETCTIDSSKKNINLKNIIRSHKEFFNRQLFENNPEFYGSKSNQPIFIVGMPRSGKTIIESILTQNKFIHGSGEIHTIPNIIKSINSNDNPFPQCLSNINKQQLSQLAEQYLQRINNYAKDNPQHIVDTMPINYLHLGFIYLLFPNAKIIHCTRNPIDCCLYNYFKYFANGNKHSYDLQQLGEHYLDYKEIMQHWNEHLPTKILEVKYENLINNPQKIINQITKFLEIESNEDIAKDVQLHSDEIDMWKNYEKFISPLIEKLQ